MALSVLLLLLLAVFAASVCRAQTTGSAPPPVSSVVLGKTRVPEWSLVAGTFTPPRGAPADLNQARSGAAALEGFGQPGSLAGACAAEVLETATGQSTGRGLLFGGLTAAGIATNQVWEVDTDQMLRGNESAAYRFVRGSPVTAEVASTLPPIAGVESAVGFPGSRYAQACWFDDIGGALFVFGGSRSGGSALLADLWSFSFSSRQWTLWGSRVENSSGTYPPRGVPSTSGWPGARAEASVVSRRNGETYLLGGYGFGSSAGGGSLGALGDVWRYTGGFNEWTFVAGSQLANVDANLAAGIWGGRAASVAFDGQNVNELLAFGGRLASGASSNDLWLINLVSGSMQYLGGNQGNDTFPALEGEYGGLGQWETRAWPPSRAGSCSWSISSPSGDGIGVMWGGSRSGQFQANGTQFEYFLADLWAINVSSRAFSFIGGSPNVNARGLASSRNALDTSFHAAATRQCSGALGSGRNLFLRGGPTLNGVSDTTWHLQTADPPPATTGQGLITTGLAVATTGIQSPPPPAVEAPTEVESDSSSESLNPLIVALTVSFACLGVMIALALGASLFVASRGGSKDGDLPSHSE